MIDAMLDAARSLGVALGLVDETPYLRRFRERIERAERAELDRRRAEQSTRAAMEALCRR